MTTFGSVGFLMLSRSFGAVTFGMVYHMVKLNRSLLNASALVAQFANFLIHAVSGLLAGNSHRIAALEHRFGILA